MPAKTLFLNAGTFRFSTNKASITGTMRLAKGMATRDKCHGFFIIHRHPRKGFTDVTGRSHRVRLAIRAFRIDIDQAHLHSGKRVFKLTVTRITLVTQPGVLSAPIDVFFRLEHIYASAGEAECLEAHRFQRAVAGKDHQIRPGQRITIFLLDGPQETTRLIEVRVVRPAVQRGKTQRPCTGAAAAVTSPICAGAMPCHADEEWPVMAIVCRPPLL